MDFDEGTITIPTSKTGEAKFFPVSEDPELTRVLKAQRALTKKLELKQGRIIPRVFHRNGKPLASFPYKAWRAACRRAEVLGKDGRPKRPHDFRRTFARDLRRSGVSAHEIQDLAGWKTGAMLKRYDIIDDSDRRSAVAARAASRSKRKEA